MVSFKGTHFVYFSHVRAVVRGLPVERSPSRSTQASA
jgi:hypothetical protein